MFECQYEFCLSVDIPSNIHLINAARVSDNNSLTSTQTEPGQESSTRLNGLKALPNIPKNSNLINS